MEIANMKMQNTLTYIANAGVLLRINNKKILIDGLCASEIPLFKNTQPDIYEKLIAGVPPYDNIDLMLITHNHSDHFDAEMCGNFLKQSPNTFVIANSDVISRIKDYVCKENWESLIELQPKTYCREKIKVKDIVIEAISMLHDGHNYSDVNNLAFLIECGKKVLHLGDAAFVKENSEALKLEDGIDLLIANFPWVCLPAARKIIKENIKPQKLAIVHLPNLELDSLGWINSAKKNYERVRDKFMPTELLEDLGLSIII